MNRIDLILKSALSIMFLCMASSVAAQEIDLFADEAELLDILDDEDKNELVVAPIPIVNPTFGNGLAAIAMYLYKLDEGSQESFTAAGGAYTDSKSYGFGIAQVGERLSDYNTENILPSAGVGLRFKLSKTTGFNLSFDYARGEDSGAWYFYVGESF